jgi:hypothetical protein
VANTVVVSTADSNMDDVPLWQQASGGDAAISYTGAADRGLLDALIAAEGILSFGALKVTQRGAGANFSVDVAAGMIAILGDNAANQGKYVARTLGVVNVVTPTAPGSGTRVHRIIARVRDKQVIGSGTYDWTLELLEDTGTGTPAEPSSAVTLATVSIAAGQASVLNANITDLRPYAQTFNNAGLIAVTTLTGTAASVTFSSIPQIYHNLRLVGIARGDTAAAFVTVGLRCNGDSAANYDSEQIGASGSTAGAFESINETFGQVGECTASTALAGSATIWTITIPHYTQTTWWKFWTASHMLNDQTVGGASGGVMSKHWAARWRNTAAITSLTLLPSAGNFVANSVFALYGEI